MQTSEALVMAINEEFVAPATCALYSVGVASPETERVIVLGSDISQASTGMLEKIGDEVGLSVEVRDCSQELDSLEGIPVSWNVTKDAWSRLLVPEICDDVDRCLYVDADILCLSGLGELFATDLGDNTIGAVLDTFEPSFKMLDSLPGYEPKEQREPYFNSGVLLIDCNAWREDDVTPRTIEFARQYYDYIRYCDQDALNGVLQGKWLQLDPRWNAVPVQNLLLTSMRATLLSKLEDAQKDQPHRDLEAIENEARILHYITPVKPWRPDYPDSPQRTRYTQVMQKVESVLGV